MLSQTKPSELVDLRDSKFEENIFPAAKEDDWTTVKLQLNLYAKEITDFGRNESKTRFTILHYACNSSTRETALKAVKDLFRLMEKFSCSPNVLIEQVNKKDCNGRTPLCLAIEKGYDEVVEFLLNNSADVTLLEQEKINDRFHNIMRKIYDRGIKLTCDRNEATNEYLWSIRYDFSAITGFPSQYDPPEDYYLETKTLATILTLSSGKRRDILTHPLVQLFVQAKAKKYSYLIWLSICCHIFWYLMCATFLINTVPTYHRTTNVNTSFISANSTNYKLELREPIQLRFETASGELSADENDFKIWINDSIWLIAKTETNTTEESIEHVINVVDPIQATIIKNTHFSDQHFYKIKIRVPIEFDFRNLTALHNETSLMAKNPNPTWFTYIVFIVSLIISLTKEFIELKNSPSKNYYWNQYENRGQWAVLGLSTVALFVPFYGNISFWVHVIISTLYSIGISLSLFLIQSQFTKTDWFGVYNLMMIKSFKKLLRFIIAFIPLLVAYVVVLNTLLPQETGFTYTWGIGFGRILAMLTGELNYPNIFSEDNLKQIPNVVPSVVVFILFILTVVILLQNLFIGLTVSNIEKLKEKAIAAHIATRLEVIYLLEVFVTLVMEKIGRVDCVIRQYSVIKQTEDAADLGESNIGQGITDDFLNIPRRIQAIIREKKGNYVNGLE